MLHIDYVRIKSFDQVSCNCARIFTIFIFALTVILFLILVQHQVSMRQLYEFNVLLNLRMFSTRVVNKKFFLLL